MKIQAQQFRYEIDPNRCEGCGTCVAVCPTDAILIDNFVAKLAPLAAITCIKCGACRSQCPTNAIMKKLKESAIFTEITATPADPAGSSPPSFIAQSVSC